MNTLFKRARRLVKMLVVYIGRTTGHRGGRHDLKIRIVLPDGIEELGKSAIITPRSVKEVFVPDLYISQREWRRMAIGCALRSPRCTGASGDVLNFIESILDIRLEGGAGSNKFAIERVPSVHRQQWLHIQVFAPLQELE